MALHPSGCGSFSSRRIGQYGTVLPCQMTKPMLSISTCKWTLHLGFLGLTKHLSPDCSLEMALPDQFLTPPSHLLFFRGLAGWELPAGPILPLPLEQLCVDPYLFARRSKGKWKTTMGPGWLFWQILCWVDHSTKPERNILYFCQNKKLVFHKELKNAFLFSKQKLQPFQSRNFS